MSFLFLPIYREKLSLFDTWSLSLLHRLWKHGKGFTFLITYCPIELQSVKLATTGMSVDLNSSMGPGMYGSISMTGSMSLTANAGLLMALQSATNAVSLSTSSNDGEGNLLKAAMTNSISVATSSPNAKSPTRASINNRGIADERFFIKYMDDPRFMRLELKLLEKDAIVNLARDAFHPSRGAISDSFLDKVYEISGGNPLYAFEIANSVNSSAPIFAAITAEDDKGAKSPTTKSNTPTTSIEQLLATTSNRIEEVICYRFDQLRHSTQILLKTAAVICSSGNTFSYDLLASIMMESDGNNAEDSISDSMIVQALAQLVAREEFVHIVHVDGTRDHESDGEDTFDADHTVIRQAHFGFRVVLEQLTIYNLLVSEKKEKIHDAVASYYRRKALIRESSVEDLLEEAYHWQHAMVWAYALGCYYKAATKLWEIGDYRGYQTQLQSAFRIYHNLRNDVGVLQTAELQFDKFAGFFHSQGSVRTMNNLSSSSLSNYDAHARSSDSPRASGVVNDENTLSYELIHEMCYSDSETLATILNTHVAMAQFNMLTLESPLYTTLLLEEALQLMILSKAEPASVVNSPVSSFIKGSISGSHIGSFRVGESHTQLASPRSATAAAALVAKQKQNTSHALVANSLLKKSVTQAFRLHDFAAINYTLYAAFIYTHSWAPTSNSARLLKAEFLCERFVSSVNNDRVKGHGEHIHANYIQAITQWTGLHIRQTRLKEAWQYGKRLMKKYDVNTSCRDITQLYGLDSTNYTLALLSQQLFLVGDIQHGLDLLDFTMANHRVMTNPYNANMSFLPICSTLLFLHRYDDAVHLLEGMEELDSTSLSMAFLPQAYKTDVKSILVMKMKLIDGILSENAAAAAAAAEVVEKQAKPSRRNAGTRRSIVAGNGLNNQTRKSISAENGVLPPTLAAEEEYAPRKQSYLGHVMFINGMAAEAVKLEIDMLKQLRSMTMTPSEIMQSFTEKYLKFIGTRNKEFDAFVMSELWPLMSLLILYRGKEGDDVPRVPRSLIKAVIDLVKRCESHQYFLASAVLGEFLAEMNVPAQVQQIGEKVRARAFRAIEGINRPEKLRMFDEAFRLIVRMDYHVATKPETSHNGDSLSNCVSPQNGTEPAKGTSGGLGVTVGEELASDNNAHEDIEFTPPAASPATNENDFPEKPRAASVINCDEDAGLVAQ